CRRAAHYPAEAGTLNTRGPPHDHSPMQQAFRVPTLVGLCRRAAHYPAEAGTLNTRGSPHDSTSNVYELLPRTRSTSNLLKNVNAMGPNDGGLLCASAPSILAIGSIEPP